MCIILFQFLKQQVEFVNENNISDMEQASMTNQDPGQRFRRIRQANQDVSRPSIVEPSLKEQVCSHFKILIYLYVCTYLISLLQSQMQYDSTGMYHWCPSRNINDCLMDRQEAAMTILQVCRIVEHRLWQFSRFRKFHGKKT